MSRKSVKEMTAWASDPRTAHIVVVRCMVCEREVNRADTISTLDPATKKTVHWCVNHPTDPNGFQQQARDFARSSKVED